MPHALHCNRNEEWCEVNTARWRIKRCMLIERWLADVSRIRIRDRWKSFWDYRDKIELCDKRVTMRMSWIWIWRSWKKKNVRDTAAEWNCYGRLGARGVRIKWLVGRFSLTAQLEHRIEDLADETYSVWTVTKTQNVSTKSIVAQAHMPPKHAHLSCIALFGSLRCAIERMNKQVTTTKT